MSFPESARVWSEIDPAAIRHNAEFAIARTGTGLMAVVKADAYGHGVEFVVPALRDIAEMFAVSNVEEAAEVAAIAPEKDVLLLSPSLSSERKTAVEMDCIATVSRADEAEAFGKFARVSLKVDTGMGRIGTWHEQALAEVEKIAALPGIALHSIATHLPSADEDETFTRGQLADFAAFADRARAIAPAAKFHALNSAGICGFPGFAFDFVRAGLLLYGGTSVPGFQQSLRPALAWKTLILLVRDVPAGRGISYGRTFVTPRPMRIATLAAGYADGYPRQVSGKGAVALIGGKRCPLLGRVTMDQILVDVSEAPGAAIGGEAVLIGKQGGAEILAAEVAEWADTISWDIFTGLRGRTKRICIEPQRRGDAEEDS